jgi:hypothetical protein
MGSIMCDETDKTAPTITTDRFQLDFGKNIFRPGERAKKEPPSERKLPPVPGRVPIEPSIPPEEVLNRGPKK